MALQKRTYVSGETVITAENLNAIQDEIIRLDEGAPDVSLGLSSTATGKMVKISSVDSNGKPTAWETIDGISGQVTAEKINSPDHLTDLVQYAAFQVAANQIIKQIPTVPDALKSPKALTIKIGSTSVTYDGSEAKSVTIDDGTEVSY